MTERDIFEHIKNKINVGFELTYGPATYIEGGRVSSDAALYKDNIRLAVFEFSLSMDTDSIGRIQDGLIMLALKYNIPYAIICNADKAYLINVYGYADKGYIPDYMSLDEALATLFDADDQEHPISDYYAEKLHNAIITSLNSCGIKEKRVITQFNSITQSYIMQHATQVSLFNSVFLDFEFEKKIFSILLGISSHIDSVCRYTSLRTAFRIIESKKNSLCSIVCMNDKSECYYVDKYLYNNAPEKLSEMGYARVKELNSNFIMSCSDIKMKDDLSMWRMYGDEAKGVCLEYKVDNELQNHHFLMAPVSYAQPDGTHPELDFIKSLLLQPLKKYRIVFRNIDVWKHFFKPSDYTSENEIRLLYVEQEASNYKWIQTGEPILAPIVEFDIAKNSLGYFPLQLKEIMLGPKCAEKDSNVAQIRYRIDLQDLNVSSDFKVSMSKIDNYR